MAAAQVSALIEQRLAAAGVQLTLGGEPTYVPDQPEGAEWSFAADGPTKLGYARALAAQLQLRAWPGSTLMYCPGKRYDGEVNPRWALRLFTGPSGEPVVVWPQSDGLPRPVLPAEAAERLLAAIGRGLGCSLQPLQLRDPLDEERSVWAAPLSHNDGEDEDVEGELGWQPAAWPLAEELRELLGAPGPAGLRLPLQHFPEGVLRQVLTLEVGPSEWSLFLPPLARQPLEQVLGVIASASGAWSQPDLSGVLPLDIDGAWQVLGLTADPGVLEVNLPVCPNWDAYAGWMGLLEDSGAAVGLRSWKQRQPAPELLDLEDLSPERTGQDALNQASLNRAGLSQAGLSQAGTGGGNHLLWGGPSLEQNPFFSRPVWLVGLLRFWQQHPSLSYLFSGNSVGPASQAPRPDEGSADWLDLQLAHQVLAGLPGGDQRVAISETLRHLHADKSGNTHRSEISLDKFWNPAWAAGCQGLIEFRAMETLPHSEWSAAIALLWSALAAHLLEPAHRPVGQRPWGEALHDRCLLPSELWADLDQVLALLAVDGLVLDPGPFRQIWQWRFPRLLHWRDGEAELEIRRSLEPWPLLCDTPVEGGSTSRFVDSSLRRFEVITSAAFRQRYGLVLQGRPLALPAVGESRPLAVRYRLERLYPCLHPTIAPHLPLELALVARNDGGLGRLRLPAGDPHLPRWTLLSEDGGFLAQTTASCEVPVEAAAGPWRGASPDAVTVDLRLP